MLPSVNTNTPARRRRLLLLSATVALLGAGCARMTPIPDTRPSSSSPARIYWTDAGSNTIQRAGLDGSGVETW